MKREKESETGVKNQNELRSFVHRTQRVVNTFATSNREVLVQMRPERLFSRLTAVTFILGVTGVGKTWLIDELIKVARNRVKGDEGASYYFIDIDAFGYRNPGEQAWLIDIDKLLSKLWTTIAPRLEEEKDPKLVVSGYSDNLADVMEALTGFTLSIRHRAEVDARQIVTTVNLGTDRRSRAGMLANKRDEFAKSHDDAHPIAVWYAREAGNVLTDVTANVDRMTRHLSATYRQLAIRKNSGSSFAHQILSGTHLAYWNTLAHNASPQGGWHKASFKGIQRVGV